MRVYKPRGTPLSGREEGQAAVEFLLVFPFVVLFLALLVDLGIMMYEFVSVSNAAREGARYGAVNCGTGTCTVDGTDPDGVRTRTLDHSGGILKDAGEVSVTWADNDGAGTNSDRGDSVVVNIVHPYRFLFFKGVTIDVTSCADMRLEQRDKSTALPPGTGCP